MKNMSVCHKSEPLDLASTPHGDFNWIFEHHATKGYWKANNKKKKNKTKVKKGKKNKLEVLQVQ
jgi:hypothetical protein